MRITFCVLRSETREVGKWENVLLNGENVLGRIYLDSGIYRPKSGTLKRGISFTRSGLGYLLLQV